MQTLDYGRFERLARSEEAADGGGDAPLSGAEAAHAEAVRLEHERQHAAYWAERHAAIDAAAAAARAAAPAGAYDAEDIAPPPGWTARAPAAAADLPAPTGRRRPAEKQADKAAAQAAKARGFDMGRALRGAASQPGEGSACTTRGDGKFDNGTNFQRSGQFCMVGPNAFAPENAEETVRFMDQYAGKPSGALPRRQGDKAPPGQQQQQQQQAAGFSFAPPPEPEHTVTEGVDKVTGAPTVAVEAVMPAVESAAEVTVDITPSELQLRAGSKYRLIAKLPFPVDDSSSRARWVKAKHKLVVTLTKA